MPNSVSVQHILYICVLIVCISLQTRAVWRTDRSKNAPYRFIQIINDDILGPKLMGSRISLKSLSPTRRQIRRRIVAYHNFFRASVVPPAANMLKMNWHKGAAAAAQRWSQECMFLTHDNVTGRYIQEYGTCGQNIFVANKKVPWLFAIKTWYLEKDNFTYESNNNDLKEVGHYAQMVWAATHQVGCGIARCYRKGKNEIGKVYYNYVCNYCPIGNRPKRIGRPYHKGKPCGACKESCYLKRLCTNSCPASNLWANCRKLHTIWPTWLCYSEGDKGLERLKHCKATCTCKGTIYD